MIVTKSKLGQTLWDVPDRVEPWICPEPYSDETFICWKFCLNEYYGLCYCLTKEQLEALGLADLKNGEFRRIDLDKKDLEKLGISPDFMSKNYNDFPERRSQSDE